ncbi:plasminogen-like isoform X2 [Branchiostoma floridae x Branchiostoma belcheri]
MTPAKYPSLEQNYCRNPDGESGLWCYTTDSSVRWGYCNVPPCVTTGSGSSGRPTNASCRVGDGASYRGTVSVTATGATCQRWDSQTPHRHTMTPAKYPSLEQNYCRNPDGESGVWCYTTDPSVRWGYCNVPPCVTTGSGGSGRPTNASCRVGDGASYRGTVSVTATGKTCQRWDSQTPHRHTMTPAKYPSLEQNYCRNPDGESGVWCYTTDPSVRWGYCNVPPCVTTGSGGSGRPTNASCRVGDGASYRGTVSVTATGKTCQRWDSQTPHRHTMTPAKYPSLEQNYCRNPDGESGVWCYTTDPSVRWGYCNVPPCVTTGSGSSGRPTNASCRVGDGASYRGTVSVTATGKTCQRWDSQTPHRHTMTPAKYPSLEQNYCRNPDGESGLWCYTTDPSVRWGYCNVPPCEANCPAHSYWSQHGSDCRPSCDDPSPRCTKGTRTYVPGCHCETGHVWEGDVCVPLSDCPARSCQQGGKTYQLGETWARQDAPGTTCRCSQNGTVHCEQKKCPHGELIGEDGSGESVAPGVPSCVNTTRSQPVARTDSNLYNVNEK